MMNTHQPNSLTLKQKKNKNSSNQIEFHIAAVYEQIKQLIQEKESLQIQLPEQVPTVLQRFNLLKNVIYYFIEEGFQKSNKSHQLNMTEQLECSDCQNYEKSLQKMEAEVRNHIRTHQQLKLYQDNLEQKIEEYEKKMEGHDNYKKKYEEMKNQVNTLKEKGHKLEVQNQKLKIETKSGRKFNKYESNKENVSELSHRNNSRLKDRTSIEKRNESTQKMRVSVNVRSAKGIPITNKIQAQKSKEEKAKILRNRLGYGY